MNSKIVSKYIGFGELEEGYHRVNSFSFTKVNKERRVRVDLQDNTFIIIPEDHIKFTERNFNNEDLLDMNYSREMFLHFWLDFEKKIGLHFYDSIWDPPLRYDESILQDIAEILEGTYKVLLFSIVKINGEDQVRVDINDIFHFILPKNHHQVKMENIAWWNKQRSMVHIWSRNVEFLCEEDFPYHLEKWMCKPQDTDEKEDEPEN